MTSASANAGTDIDLSQFYQVFFEEAGENLDRMEAQLLAIDIQAADDEELNSIFRCAHSVKGGAATFGFADVAELTHQMETLLDKLRRHELAPTTAMVDVLLQSGDVLKAQLARHQGGDGDPVETAGLLGSIRALSAGGGAPQAAAARSDPPARRAVDVADPVPHAGAGATMARQLEVRVGPLPDPTQADSLVELFREISDLGTIEPIDGGQADDGIRRFRVVTISSDEDLLDLFTFHVARDAITLLPVTPGYGFYPEAPGSPAVDPHAMPDPGYGFFDHAPGAPEVADSPPSSAASNGGGRAAKTAAPAAAEASTLRVSVDKVDQLINLVGELVITQAMLAQTGAGIDPALYQQLASGLADLERNTRDLQESVMSIRMIPMSVVFSRFPRMLRDLAAKLDKKVDFVTLGESTELDKGLVEKITDPLTHLVRNSCDHGIETPAQRIACGKPEEGTITLAASHQGGSIVIEVRDNGRGLSRTKLLNKARERGIDAPDSMADAEVWNLILAPGFSTADVVTDVSGRGVGMDVVKKNITALGGTVEIDSSEGHGMSVKVRLPLTLAIMDSMSVGVGDECYILPLSSVIESFQLSADKLRPIGGSGRVVQVRDEYLPVVELDRLFEVPRPGGVGSGGVMVVVESDGARMALLVDELLGQQQVVVKNLESNYRKVEHISGATIMGDGRVALILDVGSLVRRSRH
jgi:two-component system chemotaxis sensor kinase CheA